MSENRLKTFTEFWPYYIGEHSKGGTRAVHFLATSVGLGLLVYVVFTGKWLLLPIGPVVVYGPLFLSHFVIEKNRPATFKYPLLSVLGDLKMWWLILTGRLSLRGSAFDARK